MDESKRLFIPDFSQKEVNQLSRINSPVLAFVQDCCDITGDRSDIIENDFLFNSFQASTDKQGV